MLHLFFYRLFILLYTFGIRVASLQNKKAGRWLKGRKNWQQNLQTALPEQRGKTVWMHCASLGEFEQGRPVLEQLKQQQPGLFVVVSFFSPSGYEVIKNYKGADVVCYLPMDGAANARHFADLVKPNLVLWVKYEYWYFYLTEISRRKIPLLLISGIFRPSQPFFRWYGTLYREMLRKFTHLFVQNKTSLQLTESFIDPGKITVSGDTRFDRVIEIAGNFQPIELVESWLNKSEKVVVAGSTWDEDVKEFTHYTKLHPEIKFIIAPHNINEEEIADNLALFPDAVLFSALSTVSHFTDKHILIIDNVGMLARLYHYATVAYIGGGFGDDGIHNVLEAAVYSKPVVHGPEYEKFAEAKELIEQGASFEVEDALELEKILDKLFTDVAAYNVAAKAAGLFVHAKTGASAQVVEFIYKNRLLTS